MSFKDKETIMRKYAKEYNRSKIIELAGIDLLKDDRVSEEVNKYMDSEDKYLYYYSLQTKIDYVLDTLSYECSQFLRKEFFSFQYKGDWWYNLYSRSTYYRLKKKSMEQFLGLLYA